MNPGESRVVPGKSHNRYRPSRSSSLPAFLFHIPTSDTFYCPCLCLPSATLHHAPGILLSYWSQTDWVCHTSPSYFTWLRSQYSVTPRRVKRINTENQHYLSSLGLILKRKKETQNLPVTVFPSTWRARGHGHHLGFRAPALFEGSSQESDK